MLLSVSPQTGFHLSLLRRVPILNMAPSLAIEFIVPFPRRYQRPQCIPSRLHLKAERPLHVDVYTFSDAVRHGVHHRTN
ncbi:hypothetical protein FHR34_000566 [Kitasatospora kifunensis]|uniref:Uncharacterized protein n=1 Tax=Kitasatospora kifunensis TaxID=58351 RepID=A0A7W7QXF9_KITKI|nr:hypothetical protein [Kitasatospora kifunensis]